jgi:hypothetical protein
MESVGFKEWAAVCQALGEGRQSIILRKGGIAEGRAGFSFQYREFFLFPTWFHEQPQKIRGPAIEMPKQLDGLVEIKYAAVLELARTVTSWAIAEALGALHILKAEVVRDRFEYDDEPGLHIAFVRIYRTDPIWPLANEKRYAGCRSWVELPDTPADMRLEPVLTDAEHTARQNEFLTIVNAETSA